MEVVIGLVTWGGTLAFLLLKPESISSVWDRVTRGKRRPDRQVLEMMLHHLRENPETWSISRSEASFPNEGSKQIYIMQDKGKWFYSLPGSGVEKQQLTGFYEKPFAEAIRKRSAEIEGSAMLRTLYPDMFDVRALAAPKG